MIFIACERESVPQTDVIDETAGGSDLSFSIENREVRPVILGKQKNNPYSVENMLLALDTLRAYANAVGDEELQSNAGIRAGTLETLSINTTDLYVRFLPQDSIGYAALKSDSTLELFNYPLDYEIVQAGDYYYDPTVGDNVYTWLYAVVKPCYQPPQGVVYEVPEELFIIENSEGYTEETISEEEVQIKSNKNSPKAVIDDNLRKALVATSFVLTGNGGELRTDCPVSTDTLQFRRTVTSCSRKCILWGRVCWTTCDYKYYPEGYIRVNTPSGDVGLKGVKVRTTRWFHTITMRTNSSGYYQSPNDYYDDILILNTPHYEIIFDGANGGNSWTLSKALFGAICLWTNSYGAGYHSPNGHSMTFYTNSDYWGKAVLNNAVYDYIDYATTDGISLPPSSLDIANKQSSDLTSSAPLLKNHIDWALIYASPFWGTVATVVGYSLFGWSFPDLILRYNKTLSDYNKITATCWHELTHASQLRRMKSEKGFLWASDYWSHVVLQEASNYEKTGGSYGNKGDTNWQIIALAEGWANYREWDLARRYLNYNIYGENSETHVPYYFDDYSTSIAIFYGGMFDRLVTLGCSFVNIEKSLCAYSIGAFRNNLTGKYPNRQQRITEIIQPYE